MSHEPSHIFFGTPLTKWIEAIPNELEVDAIGLWQIIPTMRKGFGLDGEMLENAIRSSILGVLARGAKPVVGSRLKHGSWEIVGRYGDTADMIVDAIISEWRSSGRDPDVGDIWFALPRFYESKSSVV